MCNCIPPGVVEKTLLWFECDFWFFVGIGSHLRSQHWSIRHVLPGSRKQEYSAHYVKNIKCPKYLQHQMLWGPGLWLCNCSSYDKQLGMQQKPGSFLHAGKLWCSVTLSLSYSPFLYRLSLTVWPPLLIIAWSPSSFSSCPLSCFLHVLRKRTNCFHGNSSWLPQVETAAVWLKHIDQRMKQKLHIGTFSSVL